tara:strand:+ start:138 stop:425 length:288 start_codon:yes stop_codon:yes gene_type:complete
MVVGMTVSSAMSVSATLWDERGLQFFDISTEQVQQTFYYVIFLYQEVIAFDLARGMTVPNMPSNTWQICMLYFEQRLWLGFDRNNAVVIKNKSIR